MKIYVASSWRNNYQPSVVEFFKLNGHKVYDFRNPEEGEHGFAWSDIDSDWQNWTVQEYQKALLHPIAKYGFKKDFEAMAWSDVCVLVLPCGSSAHTVANLGCCIRNIF